MSSTSVWMRPPFKGLSHGLKSVHRTLFAPDGAGLSSPSRIKKEDALWASSFLVREMGLEPTRHNHTHLKRACLPFQHSRK